MIVLENMSGDFEISLQGQDDNINIILYLKVME